MRPKIQKKAGLISTSAGKQPGLAYWDLLILLAMGCLLFIGSFPFLFLTYNDPAKYACYSTLFWHGRNALNVFPPQQCSFLFNSNNLYMTQAQIVHIMQAYHLPAPISTYVESQSLQQPFHALPHEYPFLTIFPFSITLFAPPYYSGVVFACGMILLAGLVYLVLRIYDSPQAALTCACYFVIGGWTTLATRFDLIPSVLTLLALLCATRNHWNRAFALLAIATLLKFYPVYLLLPLLLAQQMATRSRWYHWRRWLPAGIYIGLCLGITLISLLLSVEGTLAPFSYFGSRPIQVESLSASVLWLLNAITHTKLTYQYTFGSLNIISPYSSALSFIGSICMIAGLIYTFWLQWRGKIDLATSMLLFLLIVIITAKVFSPQYLIWIIPLAAYVGKGNRRWVALWILIGALTTWIYPFIYLQSSLEKVGYLPLFHPVTTIRNCLFLVCVISLLVSASRKSPGTANTEAIAEPVHAGTI